MPQADFQQSFQIGATEIPEEMGQVMVLFLNAEKIKNDLGWEPKIQWDEGFEQTVTWYLENKDWWEPLLKQGLFGQRIGKKA